MSVTSLYSGNSREGSPRREDDNFDELLIDDPKFHTAAKRAKKASKKSLVEDNKEQTLKYYEELRRAEEKE